MKTSNTGLQNLPDGLKVLVTGGLRGLGHVEGAKHIVEDAFRRVALDHGDVFVGSGVIDGVGLVGGQNPVQAAASRPNKSSTSSSRRSCTLMRPLVRSYKLGSVRV